MTKCPFEPVFARVIVQREILKSKFGLIIPENAAKREASAVGIVVAVGPTADLSIEVGQKVLFGRFSGEWMEREEGEYFILQDEDILAIIKE